MEENPEILLLDLRAVLKKLSISRSLAYTLISQGALRPVRIGRSIRFRRADIEIFVEKLSEARR